VGVQCMEERLIASNSHVLNQAPDRCAKIVRYLRR